MPSTPRSIISSKNSRILSGDAPSNNVVFVVTRNPRWSAALIPSRLVEDAVAAHRLVVLLPEPVHVHAERQVLGRREQVELLLEQDGVGAEIDVLPPLHELGHQSVDVGVHERLAARNAHDGRPALFHGLETGLDRQVLLEDLGRVLDLAAAGAGEVASEEGLEHQDERVALPATQLLLEDVARDGVHLGNRHAHLVSDLSRVWLT